MLNQRNQDCTRIERELNWNSGDDNDKSKDNEVYTFACIVNHLSVLNSYSVISCNRDGVYVEFCNLH